MKIVNTRAGICRVPTWLLPDYFKHGKHPACYTNYNIDPFLFSHRANCLRLSFVLPFSENRLFPIPPEFLRDQYEMAIWRSTSEIDKYIGGESNINWR